MYFTFCFLSSSQGVRQQVSAEREGRAVLGPAVCDVVPVRRLRLPTPLHADHIHSLQEVLQMFT